ncbi:hypothetical protein PHLCEN_2v11546 [Hermanssonia centrifuga]|uniref:AP-3 complex subunit delta n=1 Tax=Hermanssonia centrifuga TaxID=98765 RepID=A0A2R6NJM4_9APHY|nr:hypothetical protein PHLCEN_2v11546 [Hermanssonia centrifuga]
MDVAARVSAARRYAVQLMVKLLCDDTFLYNAGEEGSCAEVLGAAAWICGEYCGELTEPQKLLTYLLQPMVLTLPPDIVAVYLQAAIKIFGSWAAELADRWDDADLPKVKAVVDSVTASLSRFASNTDIEVQERAANTLQLLAFIRADLTAFQPRPQSAYDFGEAGASDFGIEASTEPRFPKSLYLIQPLFSSYELNPVALAAQAYVPIPEGLDLHAWIVPPPKEDVEDAVDAENNGVEPKAKKSKKGKGKETSANKVKGKKKKEIENGHPEAVVASATETEEEKAERQRNKAERLERMRDDPYYLTDNRASSRLQDDIDSIPVVRLDDLPPLPPPSAENSRLPSLRNTLRTKSPQPFVIDKVGEMPEGVVPSSPAPPSATTSVWNGAAAIPSPIPPLSSFPAYEIEDEIPRMGTPPPIKVTRAKKKPKGPGNGSGKKKRTTEENNSTQ